MREYHNMQSASVSKLKLNDQKTIYIKVDWKDNETDLFHIVIVDSDNNSWSGRYSHEFAERNRKNVEETLEQYKYNVKLALSGYCQKFQYELNHKHSESATFVWKKQYGDIALLQHGVVPVHQDGISCKKQNLIDILLAENADLKQKINEYEMNNELLNEELKHSKEELEKFICVKTSLEISLYSKFIQMLNSKKRRIDLLEENFNKIG